MDQLLSAVVAGIAEGVPLFVIASGLTLIFGVLGVLNFAHGAYFMIGGYLIYAVLRGLVPTTVEFLGAAVLAGLAVGALGLVTERIVFRPTYRHGELVTLLASYGLLLMFNGLVPWIWGSNPLAQPLSQSMEGSVAISGVRIATYDLVMIAIGVCIALSLSLMIHRTTFGRNMRAVAHDRTMAQALGIAAHRVSLEVFILGSFLAGLGGALTGPEVSISPDLALNFILPAFMVIVIGGVGSTTGTLVGALILGLSDSLLVNYAPSLDPYSMYLAVSIVLLIRPSGLFGQQRIASGVF